VLDRSTPVERPIGVFDSGVGGLSILQALRAELPHEHFVYVADSGFAPYGERDDAFVIERAQRITRRLLEPGHQTIKALVVACNTATAAAIAPLRRDFPNLPIVGVEPALKPAVAVTHTKRIGVLATRGTLASQKFKALLTSVAGQAEFVCTPCDGLADAIERQHALKIRALCAQYISVTGQFGIQAGQIDTLVLGCTHYPFAGDVLRVLVGPQVHLIDNGEPVARQTRRVLPHLAPDVHPGQVTLYATGDTTALAQAAGNWLGWQLPVQSLTL